MKIFEGIPQGGYKPAKRGVSDFEYLKNSERPIATIVRDLIESWFDCYKLSIGTEKSNDLQKRLQSKNNAQHLAAFTELYIFILLNNFNCTIRAEEETENGKKPDFLVKNTNGQEFYVEVTTFLAGEFDTKRKRAIALIIDKIDEIKSSDYLIDVKYFGKPLENDINPRILADIQTWISNPNSLNFEKKFNSWSLVLKAIEKGNKENKKRVVASVSNSKVQCYSGGRFTPEDDIENVDNFFTKIKEILAKKAKKYGKLAKPYLIILNLLNNVDKTIVEDVLLSKNYPNTNGILITFGLEPFKMMDLSRAEPLYFINQDAQQDFSHCIFKNLASFYKNKIAQLDQMKISKHLKLSQEKWLKALNQEDPDLNFRQACDWIQGILNKLNEKIE